MTPDIDNSHSNRPKEIKLESVRPDEVKSIDIGSSNTLTSSVPHSTRTNKTRIVFHTDRAAALIPSDT